MSEELKKCAHCGGEPDTGIKEWYQSKPNVAVAWCAGMGCPIQYVQMPIAAWNRRYVCPDKHGKAVYAGDRAKSADHEGKVDRLAGIYIESNDKRIYHVWPHEIELIESEGPNENS